MPFGGSSSCDPQRIPLFLCRSAPGEGAFYAGSEARYNAAKLIIIFCNSLVKQKKKLIFAEQKCVNTHLWYKQFRMEIKRDIHLRRLIKSKHNGMIKVVTGIRRCGKSYLLMNLFRQHLLDEGVSDNHIVMLDLENRRNKRLRDPDALLEWIDSQIIEYKASGDVPKEAWYYVMLDEVQLVPEFEVRVTNYSCTNIFISSMASSILSLI